MGPVPGIRWWIAIVLTALFTLPEIYCLYIQFDTHPEKLVFGLTGYRRPMVFLGQPVWPFLQYRSHQGSGDPFFYFHTLLWAFCRGRCYCMRPSSRNAGYPPGDRLYRSGR